MTDEERTQLAQLLRDCAQKLRFYRAEQGNPGEYVGGVEYTELQRRIERALEKL